MACDIYGLQTNTTNKEKRILRGDNDHLLVKISLQHELFEEINENGRGFSSYLVKFQRKMMIFSAPCYVCEMEIHPLWRNYLALQYLRDSVFRFRFCCWLIEMLQNIEVTDDTWTIGTWEDMSLTIIHVSSVYSKLSHICNQSSLHSVKLCEHCSLTLKPLSNSPIKSRCTRIRVKFGTLHDTLHNLEPEIKWSIRVLPQLFQYLQLEAVFAWLSTLGGAHSALGDHLKKHAEIAWFLSVKQLYIAIRLGDPVLAAHCKLFMSISMMQRGCLSSSSKIIRSVGSMIQNDKRLQERRLINCCKAAWTRLKYMREERKAARNGIDITDKGTVCCSVKQYSKYTQR